MTGASAGSRLATCTLPRDVGRRLHTLAVKASNACSGSPNLGSDRGCTWYSTSGRDAPGDERANTPSCEGAMLIGPLRLHAYSAAIIALPRMLPARVLSVRALRTL